jgi:hypothetical protein
VPAERLVIRLRGLAQDDFRILVRSYPEDAFSKGIAMSAPVVVLRGTVKADGTLEVPEPVNLPPGEVQVTLVPLANLPEDDPFWQRMKRIWASQKARGHVPRSETDVEAERQAMCKEWQERMDRVVRIQEEAAQLRARRQPG